MGDFSEKDLLELYKKRKHDQKQATTRRRREIYSAPKSLDDILASYFQGDSEAVRRIEESRAIQAWPEFVGEAAARVSQALRLRGKTLIVRVGDPLWMQQLSFLKRELIKRYQTKFPRLGITDLYFTR